MYIDQTSVCTSEQFHAALDAMVDQIADSNETHERIRGEYLWQLLAAMIPAGQA